MAKLTATGKIKIVNEDSKFPNPDRLSIVFATILLAYALSQFINDPPRNILINILGILIPIKINFQTLVSISVTVIAVSGTSWLLPKVSAAKSISVNPHLLLPGLTAWTLSILLINLPLSLVWWLIFALGGLFLFLVMIGEYIVAIPEDARQPFIIAALSGLSYAGFLILAISLRSTKPRLVMLLPAAGIAAALVAIRTSHLRLRGQWMIPQAAAVSLVILQLTAGLHYLPISPIGFGIILLAPLYSITNLTINLVQMHETTAAIREPLISLVSLLILGIILW